MATTTYGGGVQGTVNHYKGAADALSDSGVAVIDSTQIDAATLVTPDPGLSDPTMPGQPEGDDAKELWVVSTTAFAHTVKTPSGKLLWGGTSAGSTLTFAAKAGANCLLRSMSGFWMLVAAQNVTPS